MACATKLSKTHDDYKAIDTIIRGSVDIGTIQNDVEIKTRGNIAYAYYVVYREKIHQPYNPMKATPQKKNNEWTIVKTKSTKPWYYKYK